MEETDKKYWNKQIKGMLGPCMITFAIPLTVPGLTITLVAFSEDTTFETYGVLHIVGILFLATAIILLILGCMLRILWKPFIGPDVEMHLTPLQSVTSLRKHRKEYQQAKINNIYTGARVGPEQQGPRNESRFQETYPTGGQAVLGGQMTGKTAKQTQETTQKSDLQNRSCDTDNRRRSRDSIRKKRRSSRSSIVQEDSSLEGTGSESESAMCMKKHTRQSSVGSQKREGRRHSNEGKADEAYPQERSKSHRRAATPPSGETCLDDIQQWRQRKKTKQKSKTQVGDSGVINAGSDCNDTITSRPLPKFQLNERPLSSNLENGSSTGEETNSGQSARSPRQSLLQHDDSLDRKKRRKKKRTSKSVKTDSIGDPPKPTRVLPPVLRSRHLSQSDGEHPLKDLSQQRSCSSDSINSIGSADSVLAQYTSRNPDV
ncbi:uncharacterized protein LOC132551576 [Ylistrum balloti]|uniref:uncharacterized protein LOC132551576 n=1 Tax=Ylistrum balloti TaxID=509963 RepID=UPI002905E8A1|nr:uncharacterized protein LOC132551576 [Ylistrum balloti]